MERLASALLNGRALFQVEGERGPLGVGVRGGRSGSRGDAAQESGGEQFRWMLHGFRSSRKTVSLSLRKLGT